LKELSQHYRVSTLLKVSGVSRSSYYSYLNRAKSFREKENEEYEVYISELQSKHKGRYGVLRMKQALLHEKGVNLNHKRVHRLMRKSGNLSSVKVKRKRYSQGSQRVFANLLSGKAFKAQEPYEKFVTDITEFKQGNKKLYLSAVKDLHTRMIESYELSEHQSEVLALTTVRKLQYKALKTGSVLHSDQARIYGSLEFQKLLRENNFYQSMSRSGTPTDNAPMESFFGTLKSETIYNKRYKCDNVTVMIKDFIDYYNNDRIQKSLGYLTPAQFKQQEFQKIILNNTEDY
jgi:transposase InsO family protein